MQGMSISYLKSNKVAYVACRKRLKISRLAKCLREATLHTYPTSASGIIVLFTNNQEILLDLADFTLQEQPFSSPEPPGPLSRWRLGTRTKWLWGHRITEVLDSRTSGIHV